MAKKARIIGTYAGPREEEKMGRRLVRNTLRSPGCMPWDKTSRRMTDLRKELQRGA